MSVANSEQLAQRIGQFSGTRILVVGDVMLDNFIHGTVDRVSPEAPIPVLHVRSQHEMLGGAGNTALNIRAVGGESLLIGVVGQDTVGETLANLAREQVSPYCTMVTEQGRPTTQKVRYLAGSQQLLRADTESAAPISAETEATIMAAYGAALPGCHVVVLSDYAKGTLTDSLIQKLIAMAAKQQKPVLVDPKRPDFAAYRGATVIKPNRKEFEQAAGQKIADYDAFVDSARRLLEKSGTKNLLVTRGGDGMTLVSADSQQHFPALQHEVWDVSGAGDTVIAILATAVGAGASMAEAAQLANLAAGIVVGKVGTATVSTTELLAALHNQNPSSGPIELEAVLAQVARWRRQGLRVGFTNGVFDLLHAGHIHSIRHARAACDKLIVALNTDASVRRLKGPDRPIQDEQHRAAVLAALGDVDAVTLFDTDTPIDLIARILPDVLIKGGDYKPNEVVGADIITAHGGKVVITPAMPGISTTEIVAQRGIARKA